MSDNRDMIIGIDLGTTNSLVAVFDAAGPRVVRAEMGESRVPSVLAFSAEGQVTTSRTPPARCSRSSG